MNFHHMPSTVVFPESLSSPTHRASASCNRTIIPLSLEMNIDVPVAVTFRGVSGRADRTLKGLGVVLEMMTGNRLERIDG
jgi:hypothetical protein